MLTLNQGFEPILMNNLTHARLCVQPKYFELGFSPCKEIYARSGVVDRLLLALDHLPVHLGLMIWDVYRPRAVQATLFEWMKDEVKKRHPSFTAEQIFEEAKKFAARPSVVGEAYCPSHLTGGAVDLTLFDCASGEVIPMGTPFDDCTDRAHALYFENQTTLSLEDEQCRSSRALLRNAMLSAGFVAYEYEWWHFDYGDFLWSQQTGQPVLFGPLFGDLEWPVNVAV